MVLMNGSKKARYESSLTNQNQGGGNKKAGLVPTADVPAAVFNAYNTRGLPRTAAFMKLTLFPNVQQSRPIDGRPQNYVGMGGRY
jgi:hypothetical protein